MTVAKGGGAALTVSWDEQFVPLAAIIKHQPFQVRKALDKAAVRRYGEMTRAGKVAPPIKVALIRGSHYLLDGWHRMAAGALTTAGDDVLALVASMTDKQAMWEAANANTAHGVPLKAAEIRGLFRAFIRSGQHRKAKGKPMSYREMQAALGKPHTTLRNWVRADFPKLFECRKGLESRLGQARSRDAAEAHLSLNFIKPIEKHPTLGACLGNIEIEITTICMSTG